MPDPLGSLVEAIAAVVDALEGAGLAYALGGAVAYSAWGEPRATRDIDVNLLQAGKRGNPGKLTDRLYIGSARRLALLW